MCCICLTHHIKPVQQNHVNPFDTIPIWYYFKVTWGTVLFRLFMIPLHTQCRLIVICMPFRSSCNCLNISVISVVSIKRIWPD